MKVFSVIVILIFFLIIFVSYSCYSISWINSSKELDASNREEIKSILESLKSEKPQITNLKKITDSLISAINKFNLNTTDADQLKIINQALTSMNSLLGTNKEIFSEEITIWNYNISLYKDRITYLEKSNFATAYKEIFSNNFFGIITLLMTTLLTYSGLKFALTYFENKKLIELNEKLDPDKRYKLKEYKLF